MFIDGIGIAGYRSFGPKLQRIGPFKKINLFIGQNNSGKSNILSFILDHAASLYKREQIDLRPLDRHLGKGSEKVDFEFALNIEKKEHLISNLTQRIFDLCDRLLDSPPLTHRTGAIWFPYKAHIDKPFDEKYISQFTPLLSIGEWQELRNGLTGRSGGNRNADWIPEVLNHLIDKIPKLPKIEIVPAIREVGAAGTDIEGYGGKGIIERLVQLQNPSHVDQHLRERFDDINKFLRIVVENEAATLEVPYNKETITVHMDYKALPLHALGTGIHEVIIMAVAATVNENKIICIEEPEIHLHPLLQKKLVRYLNEKTDNQYFITTHSAHLLDTPGAAIYHVRYQDGQTTVDPVYTAIEKSLICADLGYRASDLLQANCVIWVEGPSDRTYLNHWIHAADPELQDGLHYSIMFYGGRLLSHLTADDPDVEEFISLRRLNRYSVVLMDSDKSGPRKHPNATKKRIKDEFNSGPGFAWITKGREIENYVESEILREAIISVHPKAKPTNEAGTYDKCLEYKNSKGKIITADKVKVAREAVKRNANYDVLDLKQWIDKLVKFIYDSNK